MLQYGFDLGMVFFHIRIHFLSPDRPLAPEGMRSEHDVIPGTPRKALGVAHGLRLRDLCDQQFKVGGFWGFII